MCLQSSLSGKLLRIAPGWVAAQQPTPRSRQPCKLSSYCRREKPAKKVCTSKGQLPCTNVTFLKNYFKFFKVRSCGKGSPPKPVALAAESRGMPQFRGIPWYSTISVSVFPLVPRPHALLLVDSELGHARPEGTGI